MYDDIPKLADICPTVIILHLKIIEMENFKSFGKKTTIEIKSGFTAISGPNGSGKSNIGDAILFVLGPKSSRAIRAHKLTDLIFNGGKLGNRAKYCRVSLIFDNEDRIIPIDSNTVKLTRYIRLSETNKEGYTSYFYINDEKARLQDFTSLLSHARIYADGYNFVKQGDVTQIVNIGNIDRRRILEDIAGTSKYDDQLTKADVKKSDADENMGKIDILLKEIKSRLSNLSEERGIALKYTELKEKLKKAEAQLLYMKVKNSTNELESLEEQVKNIYSEIEDAKKQITKKSEEIKNLETELEEVEKKIDKAGGEEARKLKDDIDNAKLEVGRIKTTIEDAEDNIRDLKEEREEIKKEIKAEKNTLEGNSKTQGETLNTLKTKKDELEKKRQEYKKVNSELANSNHKIGDKQKELQELEKKLNSHSKEFSEKIIEKNKIKNKIDTLDEEIEIQEEDKKTVEFDLKDTEWRIKNIKKDSSISDLNNTKNRVFELRKEETKLSDELEEAEEEVKNLTREYDRIKAQIDAEAKVKSGYNRAVAAILEARDKNLLSGIHGTIAELSSTDEKYEIAIQTSAGMRLQNIVVDDDKVGAECIQYLKKNKIGRATFLPITKMTKGRPRGKAILASRDSKSIGFAIELVKYNEKYENVMGYVFGDTVVVENLNTARSLMGGVRLVTMDGSLIEASGAMVGGAVQKTGVSLKISKNTLDEIGDKLRNSIESRDNIKHRLKDVITELKELGMQIQDKMGESNKNEMELASLKKRVEEYKAKIKKINARIETKEKEKNPLKEVLKSLDMEIENLEKNMDEITKKKDTLTTAIQNLTPEKLNKKIDDLRNTIDKLAGEVSQLDKESHGTDVETKAKQDKLKSMEKRVEEINSKISDIEKKIKNLEKEKSENNNELQKLLVVEKAINDKSTKLMNTRDALYKKKVNAEMELDKLNSKITTKEDIIITLNTKLGTLNKDAEELKKELEEYNIVIEEPLPSVYDLKRKVSDTEDKMRKMEPVNMKAIDEYSSEEERYKSLKEEFDDLEAEKKELISLMNELNEKKKKSILEVYNAINENFKSVYQDLSDGGQGELVMENEKDPFSGGLIIKAKPKGKKLARLEALSGGEKSITSMAFIFAIQQYKPSPFYLLDEIDQNLDAVNAEIVSDLINRNSKYAQFIVVSLRKVTLKYADQIIGATMQNDGISTLFTKNLGMLEDVNSEQKVKEHGN